MKLGVFFQAPAADGQTHADRRRRANGIPLHKEVLQRFAECTREPGIAPLA